jgi:hypothetical protein
MPVYRVRATRFTRRTKLEGIAEAVLTVKAKDQLAARELIDRLERKGALDGLANFIDQPEDFNDEEVEGELSSQIVTKFLGEVQLDPGEEPAVQAAASRPRHKLPPKVKITPEERAASRERAASEDYAEKVGVHAAHCCREHGCKYGDRDCPVVNRKVAQARSCELCAPADA